MQDFNRLIDEATFIPFEERKFKQAILSNVSSVFLIILGGVLSIIELLTKC